MVHKFPYNKHTFFFFFWKLRVDYSLAYGTWRFPHVLKVTFNWKCSFIGTLTVLQSPTHQYIPGQHTLWVGQENTIAFLFPHGGMKADKEHSTEADDPSQEYGFRPSAFCVG